MSLVPCRGSAAESKVLSGAPSVRMVHNAIFIPKRPSLWMDHDPEWGVYTLDGELVIEAAYRRGVNADLVGQSYRRDLSQLVIEDAPASTYVYGGLAMAHYGHFLLSTFSRLWNAQEEWSAPLLMHQTDVQIDRWRQLEHVRSCLEGTGQGSRPIVTFNRPTRIHQLIVPAPAFEEGLLVFPAFRELALRTARAICGGPQPKISGERAYLTKEKLDTGVRRIANEAEVTTKLRDLGYAILSPEHIPLAEQIDCFNRYDVVVGTTGSAFHTAIFASTPPRMISLSESEVVADNFLMIDDLLGMKSEYLSFAGDSDVMGPTGFFLNEGRWRNTTALAESINAIVGGGPR